jgi:hypothetical protein
MGAAAAASAVVAAFQSLGTAAPVLLGQFGAFGLGYLTNLVPTGCSDTRVQAEPARKTSDRR